MVIRPGEQVVECFDRFPELRLSSISYSASTFGVPPPLWSSAAKTSTGSDLRRPDRSHADGVPIDTAHDPQLRVSVSGYSLGDFTNNPMSAASVVVKMVTRRSGGAAEFFST